MEKKPKNKGGRPKEKVEDKVDFLQVRKLAGHGLTDIEIGSVLGLSESTINRYKTDPEFLEALKRGKAQADDRVIASLYKRAIGFKYLEKTIQGIMGPGGTKLSGMQIIKTVTKQVVPDTTACIFWLKNRRPQDWRDVKEGAGVPEESHKPGEVEALIADAEKRAGGAGTVCH